MKRITYILSTAIFLCVACEVNHDDNRTLEYDSIEVNFASSIEGNEWPEGAASSQPVPVTVRKGR